MWQTTNQTEMANVIITDRVRKAARRNHAKRVARQRD
jgi:hypothetical protein